MNIRFREVKDGTGSGVHRRNFNVRPIPRVANC